MISRNSWPGEFPFPRPFLFLLFFSLILFFSLAPTVYSGDSGLFTAASYLLGSAHPPGYPLAVLLGKVFTFLPFGNIAFKVNLLSAVSGALSALLAYEISLSITKNSVVSIVAPLVILTSSNFILESSKAEVYTLNVFLILLIFYLCLRALREDNFPRYILMASFILGLGMGNHHIISLMLFPMLYTAIIRRKELTFRIAAFSFVVFIAGFSVYLYLYTRSIADAFIMYSRVVSFADFINIFLRTGYQGNTVQSVEGMTLSYTEWYYAIINFGLILSKEIHPLLWFFVLAGLIGTFKDRKTFWYLLITIGIWLPLARLVISLRQPTSKDLFTVGTYFLQLIPLMGIVAAVGVHTLSEGAKSRLPLVGKAVVTGLIIFLLVFIPIAMQKSSLSDFYLPYAWIKDVSKVLKPKSFFFAFGDNPAFLPFYIFGVERLRDDVLCLDTVPGQSSFHLTLSPAWKFSEWYPEFYQNTVTNVEYFYRPAREGKLYASSISSIPENIKEKFDVGLYVLVVMLKPKNVAVTINEKFKEDFAKIDYAPVIFSQKQDFMAEEIRLRYLNAILTYADVLAGNNAKDADFYYRLAMVASNREQKLQVMKHYIPFIAGKRGIVEAQKLLKEFKEFGLSAKEMKEIEEIEEDLKNSAAF